jgi:anaerobic selenocysteine-containing dehydrogenase
VANRSTVIKGLEAAEFVVTQDVFASTETNAYADTVLPAAMGAEVEGVVINSERGLTMLQAAVAPPLPGHARLADDRQCRQRDGVRGRVLLQVRGGDLRED